MRKGVHSHSCSSRGKIGHCIARVFTSGVRVLAPHNTSVSSRPIASMSRASIRDRGRSLPFWVGLVFFILSVSSCCSSVMRLFDRVRIFTPSVTTVMSLILTVILLKYSKFISTSRVTFFSLSPASVDVLRRGGGSSSGVILQLGRSSRHLLTAVLVTGGFMGIKIVVLLGFFFTQAIDFKIDIILRFLFVAILLAFLLLLFNRVVPGVCSTRRALSFYHLITPSFIIVRGLF